MPCAAHVAVAFDDLEGDAGFLQADAGEQPRHAGAHHQHLKAGALRCRQLKQARHTVGIFAVERKLRLQKVSILRRQRLAGGEVDHLVYQRRIRGRRQRFAPVSVRLEGGERPSPHRRLVFRRDAALRIHQEPRGGARLAADDRRIAREMHQRIHQRRHMGILERRANGCVVRMDRFSGQTPQFQDILP